MMLNVLSVIVSETQKQRVCAGIWASGRTIYQYHEALATQLLEKCHPLAAQLPILRSCFIFGFEHKETACEKGWQAKYCSPPPVVSHLTMQNACSSYSRLEMLTESMKPRNTLLMRVTLCRNSKTNTKQWYVPQRVACFTFVHLAHVQNRRL